MDELIIPYPDFQIGEIIDPEQHDLNNRYIENKINELVVFSNDMIGENGGEKIGITPTAPFTSTNVQALLNELVTRLQATVDGLSGAELIGSPTLNSIPGANVGEQLKSLNALLQTAYVASASIQDGAVLTSKLADGSVTNVKLGPNSVSTLKIIDGAITNAKIALGAVTTASIADLNVTAPKLADNSVISAKIQNNAIISDKLANNSVTNTKIAEGAVTAGKIGPEQIKLVHLDPQLLTLLPNSVLTGKVLALETDVANHKNAPFPHKSTNGQYYVGLSYNTTLNCVQVIFREVNP